MGILSWIIFGLIAGAIAKAIHPGKDPGGWIITIIIGIIGGVVGGWIGMMIWHRDVNDFSLASFGLAVLGAIIVLWLYRMISGRRAA